MMIIDATYIYKGVSNRYIKLNEKSYGIEVVTEHGETIATTTTGYGLMLILEDLYDNKYA